MSVWLSHFVVVVVNSLIRYNKVRYGYHAHCTHAKTKKKRIMSHDSCASCVSICVSHFNCSICDSIKWIWMCICKFHLSKWIKFYKYIADAQTEKMRRVCQQKKLHKRVKYKWQGHVSLLQIFHTRCHWFTFHFLYYSCMSSSMYVCMYVYYFDATK